MALIGEHESRDVRNVMGQTYDHASGTCCASSATTNNLRSHSSDGVSREVDDTHLANKSKRIGRKCLMKSSVNPGIPRILDSPSKVEEACRGFSENTLLNARSKAS